MTVAATHIAHVKVGHNRGKRRLWLEGPRLGTANFTPGRRYSVKTDPGGRRCTLQLAADGERKVSARLRRHGGALRPIIDLAGHMIDRVFGTAIEQVKITFRAGSIEISLPALTADRWRREAALRERLMAGAPINVGSICTGAGIIDNAVHAGLEEAGVSIAPALIIEREGDALDVALEANPALGGVALSFEASLDEVDVADLEPVDMLLLTLPCTAASRAGRAKKRGLALPEADPDAGYLVASALNLVRRANPAVLAIENVVPYSTSASAAILRSQLSRWGYRLFEMSLEGSAFGSIEERRRWVLIAISSGIAPLDLDIKPTPQRKRLRDILEPVPGDAPNWRDASFLSAHAARHAAAGSNFKEQILDPDAESITAIGRQYWKWRTTEPRIRHPENACLTRLLTVLEHGRVKGIPDALTEAIAASVSRSRAHELLGQSGIWPAFAALGRAIGEALRAIHPPTAVPPRRSIASRSEAGGRAATTGRRGPLQLSLAI